MLIVGLEADEQGPLGLPASDGTPTPLPFGPGIARRTPPRGRRVGGQQKTLGTHRARPPNDNRGRAQKVRNGRPLPVRSIRDPATKDHA